MRGARLAALIVILLVFVASLAAPLAAEAHRREGRGGVRSKAAPAVQRVKSADASNKVVARARRARIVPAVMRLSSPPPTLMMALPDFSELVPLFVWPVDGQLSSTFGRRRIGWHQGIDIVADLGTPVIAAASGTVVSSRYEPRYGRVVKIEHPNGFTTIYAHNDENLVEVGDRVVAGQPIASVGRTGRASSHHVHFEIRQAGLAYNPLYMLPLPPRPALNEETSEDHDADD
jgi:murein DD-endopeptidase MepM/ murein hydrolase activator NlpD